jgi:SAM-dependent methyltransferase
LPEKKQPSGDAARSRLEESRSSQIFGTLSPFLADRRDLLDLGGGRGGLLGSFSRHGMSCALVDYLTGPLPGIERIGSTLSDVPAGRLFDVVLCSHVFEHLADPLQLAKDIKRCLRPNGLLFIEVPLEILGSAPKNSEPVTHINFFCPSSLTTLLEFAGFEVLLCSLTDSLFETGKTGKAVRAVGRLKDAVPRVTLPGPGEAERLLGSERRQLPRWRLPTSFVRSLLQRKN